MRSVCRHDLALLLGALLCAASGALWAESGVLVVHVEDVQGHPISGVQIGTKGDGGTAFTGDDGKARIRLAKQTKAGSWVSLQILKSPPGKDFVMNSPWDSRVLVPSFENESENFIPITVMRRGDRTALVSGNFLGAATAQIDEANAQKTAGRQAPREDPKASLAAVARRYGLDPDELDKAIRTWGESATDPYQAGLAALYQRNYPAASTQLKESLQNRETKLATDQKNVTDAAFFLGQSLYEEGKYRESANAYKRCLQLRPSDGMILNNLAVSLEAAGDYAAAEPLYQRALAIREKTLGPWHPDVAQSLNNLGELMRDAGDGAHAEPLLRRALAINERALGPDDPIVAKALGNLGVLLLERHDVDDAEPILRRALAINERALQPGNPSLAISMSNLAGLLLAKGDLSSAEPLLRRALAIEENALGPDHPLVAITLTVFAGLLHAQGDLARAKSLLRRALSIDEKALGPDHPTTERIRRSLQALIDEKSSEPAEK